MATDSLRDRTLVVKNFDPRRTTKELLLELFMQGGPVRSIFIRPDHAMIEFEDIDSVGYCLALFRGLKIFGNQLVLEPRVRKAQFYKPLEALEDICTHFMYEKSKLRPKRRERGRARDRPRNRTRDRPKDRTRDRPQDRTRDRPQDRTRDRPKDQKRDRRKRRSGGSNKRSLKRQS